jgi:hypothetical protein
VSASGRRELPAGRQKHAGAVPFIQRVPRDCGSPPSEVHDVPAILRMAPSGILNPNCSADNWLWRHPSADTEFGEPAAPPGIFQVPEVGFPSSETAITDPRIAGRAEHAADRPVAIPRIVVNVEKAMPRVRSVTTTNGTVIGAGGEQQIKLGAVDAIVLVRAAATGRRTMSHLVRGLAAAAVRQCRRRTTWRTAGGSRSGWSRGRPASLPYRAVPTGRRPCGCGGTECQEAASRRPFCRSLRILSCGLHVATVCLTLGTTASSQPWSVDEHHSDR